MPDIDAQALEIARKGIYPLDLAEHIPEKMLKKYFDLTNANSYVVKKEVKNKVVFSNHNLIASPPFSRIDLISCRNLLIYFSGNLQKRVLEIFHYSLMTGGILFLGKSETLGEMDDYYRPVETKFRIHKKKALPTNAISHYRSLLTTHGTAHREDSKVTIDTKNHELAENVITAMAPNSILVDEKMNIRYIYGDIKPYAEFSTGTANMNIMNILNQDLKHDVRALVYKCINQNASITNIPKKIMVDNCETKVRISIYPLFVRADFEKLFLVNFEILPQESNELSSESKLDDSRIVELEDELATTKEYLQTVIEELETSNEELQASNEELQSVNEELQSSNEELETSNEELQSTNEELTTVNEEIQVRSGELAELNNYLNTLKDNIDIPIVVVDNELRISMINKVAEKIFAISSGVHQQIITYIPTTITIKNLQKNIESVIKNGTSYTEQLSHEDIAYYLKITPLKCSTGEIKGAVLVFFENSDLLKSEKSLRKSQDLYRLVLEATRDGIWDWPDMDKDDEYWSDTWYELLGYKPGEIKSKASAFFKMLHNDDVAETKKALDNAIKGKEPFDVEYRLRTKNGDYKWFRAKGILSEDEETGVKRMTGSLTDIDNSKRVQIALENSEVSKQAFIESSYDGYWDWHIKDDYEYMSPKFWSMLGYDYTKKKHHPSEWQKIIAPDSLKLALENFDKHISTKGEYPYSQEVKYKKPDGSYAYVLCRGAVIEWDKDNKPLRMVGTHKDVTERKKAEDKLVNYAKKLEYQNEELETLNYIASHDLKEPLRGMSHNATFIKKEDGKSLSEKSAKRLDRIIHLCGKTEQLVNDLLRYGGFKNHELDNEKIDVNELLEDVLDTIDYVLLESNAQVKVEDNMPEIYTDRLCLSEIFRNLVTNAVKHNDSDYIKIKIGFKKEKIDDKMRDVFYVKDNGIGIEKKYFDEIFKLFKKLKTHKDNISSGVGLTFVHQIIKRIGGKIWLESEPGIGTTFYFYL